MVEEQPSKWEGEFTQEINLTPEQVWPHMSDFCSIDKWCSYVDKCYLVEGVQGELGMTRMCESNNFFPCGGLQWAKEKLIMIDHSKMCYSYEVIDNNCGFKYYVATHRFLPVDGGGGKRRCKFVWSIVADPVEGFTLQGLLEFLNAIARSVVEKLEETFC